MPRPRATKTTGGTSYAQGKWAASDSTWCDFMDEMQGWDVRADVRDAAMRCVRRCHAALWPADHWRRDQWLPPFTGADLPAFCISARELARQTGLGYARVRTFFEKTEAAGFLVRLQDGTPLGEGNGARPPVFTMRCYVDAAPAEGQTIPDGPEQATAPRVVIESAEPPTSDGAARMRAKWGL